MVEIMPLDSYIEYLTIIGLAVGILIIFGACRALWKTRDGD